MIKAAQERCLLAWYVGRKKLSWAAACRTGQSCIAHAHHFRAVCPSERQLSAKGLPTAQRGISREAGDLWWASLRLMQIVGKNSSTWGEGGRLVQNKTEHFHTSASWHIGVRKLATGAYLTARSWISPEAGRPCCDLLLMHPQTEFCAWKDRLTWPMEKLLKAAMHAEVPESKSRPRCLFRASPSRSKHGMSWDVQTRKISTVAGVAALPECTFTENTAAGEHFISPASAPVGNMAGSQYHQSMQVYAEYAWPPLSAEPLPFISPKRSNYNDIIERVTQVLSDRPWGPSVVNDLNKLDVHLNTYHVAAILKVQSNTSVALGFFSWLKEKEGYQHNGFTYSRLFEILGNAKEVHSIKRLMQDMVNDKIDMIPNMFTTVSRAYANAGMLKEALLAFNSMEKYGCMPNSHAYETIIDMLVKGGCQKQADDMYHKMLECGFFPNLYVCNLLVDSYWRDERPDDAMTLFGKMKEKGEVPSINTYNFLVKGLAKGGKAEALCSVIEEMEKKGVKPNLTTYNTLIGVLVQAGKMEAAVQFFDHMVESSVKPNNFTYSFLINGLGKEGKLKEAQILFKGLKELGGSPDDYVYNALLLNLSKAGKCKAAWEVLQEMRSSGFKPSRPSYLALVASLREADKPDLVRKVFNVMETDGCSPHIVAYHDLIEKYSASKDIERACQVFQDMKKCSMADVGTYNLMLRIHGRAKDLRRCRQIFSEIRRADLEPSVVTYSTMIQVLGQSGCVKDAYNLFKEMIKKGCKPDAVAYGTVLKAMVSAGQLEKAMKVFEEGKKVHKDLVMYSIMIDGFGKARKFDKALGLLKQMKARDIQPDVVIFNSLIASLFKGGETDKAYDLYRNMPKYGCEPNKRTKDILNSLTKKSMSKRRRT